MRQEKKKSGQWREQHQQGQHQDGILVLWYTLLRKTALFVAQLVLNALVHTDRSIYQHIYHISRPLEEWHDRKSLEPHSVETGWNTRTRSLIYRGVPSFLDGSAFVWSVQKINFFIDACSVWSAWVRCCRMSLVLPTRRSGLMNWFSRTGWPADSACEVDDPRHKSEEEHEHIDGHLPLPKLMSGENKVPGFGCLPQQQLWSPTCNLSKRQRPQIGQAQSKKICNRFISLQPIFVLTTNTCQRRASFAFRRFRGFWAHVTIVTKRHNGTSR